MDKVSLTCFIWILSLLSSCGGREGGEWAHPALSVADSLMEEAPGQALSILEKDSAEICGKGKRGMMGFRLLKTHAEDKLYVTHLSDSAMLEVVDYYDGHGAPAQRAQANYVMGRVYCDMHLPGTAISSFKKVLGVKGDDADTYLYKYKAATWMATLFEEKRLWRDAMAVEKRAYAYAKRSGRTSPVVYALRDIGRLYDYQGQGKRGIPYYRKASAIARKAGNAYLYNMVEEELASVYIGQGMMAEARKSLSTPVAKGADNDGDIAARYAIWGFYYERKSMLDSALFFYKKAIPYSEMNALRDTYADLASLYKRMGNYAECAKYYGLYKETVDSLKRSERVEDENLLDYVDKSLSASKEKLEIMNQRTNLLVITISLLLVLLPLSVYVIYMLKKRKIERQLQHERLKAYRGKIQGIREKDKEELKFLREKLNASSQSMNNMQQEMLQTVEQFSACKEEMEALRQKLEKFKIMDLRKSGYYNKFHNVQFQPRRQDFIELQQMVDYTYAGFTSNLKDLCPDIRDDELWVCCMIKIDMNPTEMCRALSCKPNYMSMMRKRLYKKVFRQEGSATEFDAFIKEL